MATSWSALKAEILADLTAGRVLRQSYSINGETTQFRSLYEVTKFIEFCDKMAAVETGVERRSMVVRFREAT
jgi:hypothetical protein